MKRWVGWCAVFLLVGAVAAHAQQDLTREQVAAYVALTKADRARARGETIAAMAAYEEALIKYAAIKKQDARWHPDVVQYRMAYCANELEKLKKPAAPSTAVPPTSPAPEQPAAVLAPPPVPDPEAPVLRARITELEAALQATQALARVMSEQAALAQAALTQERDQLKARSAELESRVDVETARRTALEGQWASATGEVAALQARVAEVTAEREAEKTATKKDGKQALERARKENEALRAESDATRKILEETQQTLSSVREEAAALKAAAVDSNELVRLANLAETRLQATESMQRDRDQLEATVKEISQALAEAKASLESALSEKLALETSLSAAKSELAAAVKDVAAPAPAPEAEAERTRLEAQNKALRETIELQEKDMSRVRAFKKQASEWEHTAAQAEKKLHACEEALQKAPKKDEVEALNEKLNAMTRQLQAVRDEAARRDEQIRALETENSELKKRK